VITFVANYISTTVPAQMAVNDGEHTIAVMNGFGLLSAVAQKASSEDAVGLQIAVPISLASAGDPPFAPPDQGRITPIAAGSYEDVNYTVTGPFTPPYPGVPNTGNAGGCGTTMQGSLTTGISCTGSSNVTWNFSGSNENYSVTGNGGLSAHLTFVTNGSQITVGSTGGAGNSILIEGNNNVVNLTAKGGATVSVTLVGSNNTLSLSANGGATFRLVLVGSHDAFSTSTKGGSSVVVTVYGSYDAYSDSSSGGSGVAVYFNGFNINNPTSSACPYDNLANTNTVGGSGGTVTYNNTNYTHANGSGNASGWTYEYNHLPRSHTICPFVQGASPVEGVLGASISVELINTYAPESLIGFDEGAVVLAQPGGVPTFIDEPSIQVNGTNLSFWVPVFTTSSVQATGSTGTGLLLLRLLSVSQQSWPSGKIVFAPGSVVNVTVATPYYGAWLTYFHGLGLTPACVLVTTRGACPSSFTLGQQGVVTVAIPVTAIHVVVATFALQVV
jgi:hypothetical protein